MYRPICIELSTFSSFSPQWKGDVQLSGPWINHDFFWLVFQLFFLFHHSGKAMCNYEDSATNHDPVNGFLHQPLCEEKQIEKKLKAVNGFLHQPWTGQWLPAPPASLRRKKQIEKKLKPINGFLHQPAKGKKFEFLFWKISWTSHDANSLSAKEKN